MSAKQAVLELIQRMPEDMPLLGIFEALKHELSTQEALRRFDENGGIPDEDLTEEEWRMVASRCFEDDPLHPETVHYSENDGVPYR